MADANLKTATVNLGYTDIVAPITGRGRPSQITKGNVVGPDSGPLTMIVSRDPMYVTFPVSQREFLKVQEQEATAGTTGGARCSHPLFRWFDLRSDRTHKLRRCDGGSRDRHRAGARDRSQSQREALSMANSSGSRSKPISRTRRCWYRRRR